MANAPLLIIAAGGTGGHMFPAQALAEAMLRRGWRVKLSTDARGARYTGGFSHAVEVEQIASASFARGGVLAKFLVPLRIAAGVIAATWRMRRDRPAMVVGFGGYPSIPAVMAAWLLRRPRMLHEQNGVLGRVNRLFARRVNAIACGIRPQELPIGAKITHTGNPVRAAILERAASPYIPPGDYPMSVLVMGGSQGARILSDVVPQAIVDLPEELRRHLSISHQAREEDRERVTDFYASHGIVADVQPFFTDIPRRMSETQLVISRAGASSLADIAVIGRPSILIPYAYAANDHQRANAESLVQAEAAVLILESDLDPASMTAQIEAILGNGEAARKMAHAALACGYPDATERLVEMVEQLADTGAKP